LSLIYYIKRALNNPLFKLFYSTFLPHKEYLLSSARPENTMITSLLFASQASSRSTYKVNLPTVQLLNDQLSFKAPLSEPSQANTSSVDACIFP